MFDFLEYPFMQRALIAGTLIALIAPLIGIFLVIRRYSALADTLSHVSLVGVALAAISGFSSTLLSIITSILAGIGMEYVRSTKKVFGESILVLFLAGSLGLASILISLNGGLGASLFGYLFGSITTVNYADLNWIYAMFVLVLLSIFFVYPKLLLVSLDEEIAQAEGISVQKLTILLVVLSSIFISVSLKIVGVLLISSLMVIPVISAMQYQFSFRLTLVLASIFSVFSVWLGLFISYNANIATGGAVVLVNLLIFLISLFIAKFV